MSRPVVFLLRTLLLVGEPWAERAASQTRASLGVGVGTVRYSGGSSFSSAALSPAFQFESPTVVTSVSGSFASLPGAAWASQGQADLWAVSHPIVAAGRIGVEAALAGTSRTDGGWTAGAQGLGEVLWSRPRWGVGAGAGPSAGWIANDSSITALRTRLRAWWRPDGARWLSGLTVSIEPTRLSGSWYTDATVAGTLERSRVIASLWTTARIYSDFGSRGAASAFVQFFVLPNVAFEAGGGTYLSDPYQGLPRAGFVTVGLRLHATGRALAASATRTSALRPLVPVPRGDSVAVRFRFDNVRSVAIAGDWNQWRPVRLRSLGGSLWEGTLALRRGVYHFNLLVDGNDWVVPNGVATVSDGLGGMVGVLIVP